MAKRSGTITSNSSHTYIHNYDPHVGFKSVRSVLEIGGGYGSYAHSLLHVFPNIRKYVYIDLAPNIYVATQYLKALYSSSVIDYRETKDAKKISFSPDDKLEILMLCPWQIESIADDIDFVWNSNSFQEMSTEIVNTYAKQICRLLTPSRGQIGFSVYPGGNVNHQLSTNSLINIFRSHTPETTFKIIESRVPHYFEGQDQIVSLPAHDTKS
jgi:hypothetical protein